MEIKSFLNSSRRSLMKKLTANIGVSNKYNLQSQEDLKIDKILIVRPNARLGNQLLVTPLLQEIIETFPNCRIDLIVKGNLGPAIFKNYKNIDSIIQLPNRPFSKPATYIYKWLYLKFKHYDIVINAVKNSASGKLLTAFSSSNYKLYGFNYDTADRDLKHIAKIPVYDFRNSINRLGFEYNTTDVPTLDIKLENDEMMYGKVQLEKLFQNRKKTICLFTYATGQKCYSASWWSKFYNNLLNDHSDYNFVEILPVTRISNLGNVIPSYYSTNVRKIAAVIANSSLFIGADSGIMHLASASGTPTIGLFSCTDTEVYMPYNKNSMALNTNVNTITECVSIITESLKKIN